MIEIILVKRDKLMKSTLEKKNEINQINTYKIRHTTSQLKADRPQTQCFPLYWNRSQKKGRGSYVWIMKFSNVEDKVNVV